MNLEELRTKFLQKKIQKHDYIDAMFRIHSVLGDYSKFIKSTAVERIEISDEGVMLIMRGNGIRLHWDALDKRTAPIETLNFSRFEPIESDMMEALIQRRRVFFDIGAAAGWYSLLFAKQFPELTVHAFEPLPTTFALLKKHVALNGLNSIIMHNFGFANEDTERIFSLNAAGSGNAAMANHDTAGASDQHRCRVRKLDHFVSESGIMPDFIKCDVEGAELFVIEGGLETFRKARPIFFAEMLRKWAANFGYHPNQIIDLMDSLGYRCFTILPSLRLRPFIRMNESTEETNFIFLHTEMHAREIHSHAV